MDFWHVRAEGRWGHSVGLLLIHVHSKVGWTGMDWDVTPSPLIGCQPVIGLGGNGGGCLMWRLLSGTWLRNKKKNKVNICAIYGPNLHLADAHTHTHTHPNPPRQIHRPPL